MKLKQLSLFLENKPGALGEPVRLLAKAGYNLLTLSLADAKQFGILRLVLEDWSGAKKLLGKNGFLVTTNDVVAIEVSDRPGGLAEILNAVEKAGVNVEYMYAFTVKQEHKGVLVFRFDDPDAAVAALKKNRVAMVDSTDLARRLKP